MNTLSSWRGCGINNNGETFEVLTYVKFQQKGYCCWSLLSSFPLCLPLSSPFFHYSLCFTASCCCCCCIQAKRTDSVSCQTLPKGLKSLLYCLPLHIKKNTVTFTYFKQWHWMESLSYSLNASNKRWRFLLNVIIFTSCRLWVNVNEKGRNAT